MGGGIKVHVRFTTGILLPVVRFLLSPPGVHSRTIHVDEDPCNVQSSTPAEKTSSLSSQRAKLEPIQSMGGAERKKEKQIRQR